MMFGWVRKIFGSKTEHRESMRASYDAAKTNDDNRRHWANADDLNADSANSPVVRRVLRNRARYEFRNNSILNGMIKTLANHAVGTGPRLQLTGGDTNFNQFVAREFEKWMRAIKLPQKLRLMRMARCVDGETFAIKQTNLKLKTPVKLDLVVIETDQVTTPALDFMDPNAIDGIRFDDFGNPIEYHVLKRHPGDTRSLSSLMAYDKVPADQVIHRFQALRPGEHRGIPEITPALPLGSNTRRYSLAVLGAAETAADFAAVLQSEAGASEEDDEDSKPFVTLELEKRMMTVLPKGWRLGQLESQQPTTTYADFKRELVGESARCINMPYNIAAGNSSSYNYASGRMDHQIYFSMIEIDQDEDEDFTLENIFQDWLYEANRIPGYLPGTKSDRVNPAHEWMWPGREHVDPQKEANAQGERLRNRTATLRDEWARQGKDWKEQLRQIAEEMAFMRENDILPETVAVTPNPNEPDDLRKGQ